MFQKVMNARIYPAAPKTKMTYVGAYIMGPLFGGIFAGVFQRYVNEKAIAKADEAKSQEIELTGLNWIRKKMDKNVFRQSIIDRFIEFQELCKNLNNNFMSYQNPEFLLSYITNYGTINSYKPKFNSLISIERGFGVLGLKD